MLKTILIDDEVNCLKVLQYELDKNCADVEVIGSFDDSRAGLEAIRSMQPDLVFLDIEMPHMNGFELMEQVTDPNFSLIFTTAYDQFAVRAFKVSAIDYLMKPIDGDDLRAAVEKVLSQKNGITESQIGFLLAQLESRNVESSKTIALPSLEGLEFVPIHDIIYCRAESNYTHVHFEEGGHLVVSKTLKDIEAMLPEKQFFRVHNSFVVALSKIKRYVKAGGGYLVMSNGDEVRVSRNKKDLLIELL